MSDGVPDAERPHGSVYQATIRKGRLTAAVSNPYQAKAVTKGKTTFVVFFGDLDKLIAAFIIANGALTMRDDVTIFFTVCGINSLRTSYPPRRNRKLLDKMFAAMTPADANHQDLGTTRFL